MNEPESDSGTNKRPSFITEPNSAGTSSLPESNRVLASLGGASMAKPPRRRFGPGILAGAALMFVAGSVSTWMFHNGSSNQTAVCEPAIQMAAVSPSTQSIEILPVPSAPAASTEAESRAEPLSEAARILSTDHTAAPAAEAAPQAGHVSAAVVGKPAISAKSAASSSSATGKTRQAKSKSNRTVAKRSDKKTDVANVDPDVDIIEALLRHGSTAVDRTTGNARTTGTKGRSAGS